MSMQPTLAKPLPFQSFTTIDLLQLLHLNYDLKQCLGRFLDTINRDPSVSKSSHLHVGILWLTLLFEVYSPSSSKMIGSFSKALKFNQLISNEHPIPPVQWSETEIDNLHVVQLLIIWTNSWFYPMIKIVFEVRSAHNKATYVIFYKELERGFPNWRSCSSQTGEEHVSMYQIIHH